MTQRLSSAAKESFNNILKTHLDSETLQAIRALTGIDGKAQVDLLAMGLSAEDITALAQEVAAA